MKINKIAADDAARWARAEMFFGEGAGTRRKLLWAEIEHKRNNVDKYTHLFENAYVKQNFADHAIKAAKERKRLDRSNVIGKNVGALLRGDRRGLSNGVLVILAVGYVAHQTGYDRKALAEAEKYYRKIKTKIAKRNLQVVH